MRSQKKRAWFVSKTLPAEFSVFSLSRRDFFGTDKIQNCFAFVNTQRINKNLAISLLNAYKAVLKTPLHNLFAERRDFFGDVFQSNYNEKAINTPVLATLCKNNIKQLPVNINRQLMHKLCNLEFSTGVLK